MKSHPWILCLGLAAFATVQPGPAQETLVSEHVIKARFLARLASYGEWPNSSRVPDKSKPFQIGLLGKTELESYLREELRSVGSLKGKPVELRIFRTLAHIDQCDVLFVGSSEADRLEEVLKQLEGKPILTLSDAPDAMPRGIMFTFFVKQDRLAYDVNLVALRAAGLQVDSRVLARASGVKR